MIPGNPDTPAGPPATRPAASEVRDVLATLGDTTPARDHMHVRLRYVAGLIAAAGRLPREPLIAWRLPDNTVRHAVIGRSLVVGRQAPAEVCLPEDELLSRQHFRIVCEGEAAELEDSRSRNGTYVNGDEQRVQRRRLRDGDVIMAGNQVFVFFRPDPVH